MDYLKSESVKIVLKFDTNRIFEMLAISTMNFEEIVIFSEKSKHVSFNQNILSYLTNQGKKKFDSLCILITSDPDVHLAWNKIKFLNDTIILIKSFIPILIEKKICLSETSAIYSTILLTRLNNI